MLDTKKENRFILGILIPIILENVLLTLSSLVITGYVGRLLILEISAQGVANRLYGIYFSVFKGLSIGLMVLAARHFGSGHFDGSRSSAFWEWTHGSLSYGTSTCNGDDSTFIPFDITFDVYLSL